MTSKVCVLGSINMDIVARVDRFPKAGETITAHTYDLMPGGKGANQAIAVANMGVPVDLIGALGNDEFGKILRDHLIGNGVNIDAVMQTKSSSGTAIIAVDKTGDNQIIVIPGSNAMLQWSTVAAYLSRWGSAIKYIVSQFEIPLDHICNAFVMAKSFGTTTVLNPSPMKPIPARLLEQSDIFVLNEVELLQVANISEKILSHNELTETMIQWSRDIGDKIVIVTLGEKGLIAVQNDKIIEQVAEKVARVVDTTGAGDCFCGSLIAFLCKGYPLKNSLIFAQKAAAYSVQKKGACQSFPKIESLTIKEK